jgi:hypothetical protein
MIRHFAVATVLSAAAPAALADVTPEQVWDHWQRLYATWGATLTADRQVRDDAVLRLEGIRYVSGDELSRATGYSAWMTLEDIGDGRVRFAMAPDQDFLVKLSPPDDDPVRLPFTIRYDGLTMVIAGDPDRLETATTMDTLRIDETVTTDTEAALSILLEMEDVAASDVSDLTGGDGPPYEGDLTAAAIRLAVTGNDPETGAPVDSRTLLDDVAVAFRVEPNAMPAAGAVLPIPFTGDLAITTASGRSTGLVVADAGMPPAQFDVTTGRSVTAVSLDEAGLAGEARTDGLVYDITLGGMPEPMRITIGAGSSALTVPFGEIGQPGGFRFAFGLQDMILDDAIWSMFDPAGALDRTAIGLSLDIGGTMRWLTDITSMDADSPEPPALFDRVSIDTLDLSGLGAGLTGEGAFDIDFSRPGPRPGAPHVEGALDLAATGIDALIAQLVAAGLVPQEEVLGLRMGLALIAVPGDEPGSYNSEIRVPGDGTAVVNGVPYPLGAME